MSVFHSVRAASVGEMAAEMDRRGAVIEKLEADNALLLAAAKRALVTLKAQGESVRPGNVLGALQAAIQKAEVQS